MRDDVVVLLEGAPNGGHEPAGSGEDVREVHVLEVRLRVSPGYVSRSQGRRWSPRERERAQNKRLIGRWVETRHWWDVNKAGERQVRALKRIRK